MVNADRGEIQGSHTRLLREIFHSLDLQLRIDALPWKRCLLSIQYGKYDLVYSASKSAERQSYAIYSQYPLEKIGYVIMTMADLPSDWGQNRNPNTIPQPIGAPLGFSINETLARVGIKAVNKGIIDDTDALKLLLARRHVNAIVVADTVALDLIREQAVGGKVQILDPPFSAPKNYYIAVSKKITGGPEEARSLLGRIDAVLKQWNSSRQTVTQ